jgi:MerR family transcriptional regulator/heat shock protein HspR
MSEPGQVDLGELLELLDADRRLLEMLLEEGVLPPPLERRYSLEEADVARVARVLVRDLDVNLAGVEVILHMRTQIVSLRRQLDEMLAELARLRVR